MDKEKCAEYFTANIGQKAGEFCGTGEDGDHAEVADEDTDDFNTLCMAACMFTHVLNMNPLEAEAFTTDLKDMLVVVYYFGRWVESHNQIPSAFEDADLGDLEEDDG